MLTHLRVRDLAIVEHLELDLSSGFTVMTGETGAGKSILVDALNLALGERAASNIVRVGAARTEVTAVFDIAPTGPVPAWLQSRDLVESPTEAILRRLVTTDGRSRGYINGHPAPVQSLRELGAMLVDIHGQHAHQSLLEPAKQRDILDRYAENDDRVAEVESAYEAWKRLREEVAGLHDGSTTALAELELLRHECAELRELRFESEELEQLTAEQRRLSRAGELLDATQQALELIAGEEVGASSHAQTALRALEKMQALDERLTNPRELLDGALVHLREAADELRYYSGRLELDPQRLQSVEARLSAIHELARKHKVRPDELPDTLHALELRAEKLAKREENRRTLAQRLEEAEVHYREQALALSTRRCDAAHGLTAEVSAGIRKLGMPSGEFSVAVRPEPGDRPRRHGMDQVEFLVSANSGQPQRALAQVASGGELSRIGLAIRVIVAEDKGATTFVFDEVDAGIGGKTAGILGQELRELGSQRQVLCITHLPQVASQAHHHLQVTKSMQHESTRANLARLVGEARVEELARMLGGTRITSRTLAHAREMLEHTIA